MSNHIKLHKDDLPENFIDEDEVEHFFPEKNLTFRGKV